MMRLAFVGLLAVACCLSTGCAICPNGTCCPTPCGPCGGGCSDCGPTVGGCGCGSCGEVTSSCDCGQCNDCMGGPRMGQLLQPMKALAHKTHCAMTCNAGCNEVYWDEWISDPPDACDPCDCDGHWTGGHCDRIPLLDRLKFAWNGYRYHGDCPPGDGWWGGQGEVVYEEHSPGVVHEGYGPGIPRDEAYYGPVEVHEGHHLPENSVLQPSGPTQAAPPVTSDVQARSRRPRRVTARPAVQRVQPRRTPSRRVH